MLRELRVRDLALIEDERVPLGPGLNVLTGETGAGKSLVLGALGLLLGGRFSREMLRTGAERARVEGLFEVADADLAAAVCEALGEDPADPADLPLEIVVRRRVEAGGRNRCEVLGALVGTAQLRTLGRLLVEVHGQGTDQALLQPAVQACLLDRATGLECAREVFTDALRDWRELAARLVRSREGDDTRAARIDALLALAAEVRALDPSPGEVDGLRRERRLLVDAERHAESLRLATTLLDGPDAGGGEATGAIDATGRAVRTLEDVAELLPQVALASAALQEALVLLQDASRAVADGADRVRRDPERLEALEDRLAALGQMLRRHGPTEEEALAAADAAEAEAAELGTERDDLQDLIGRVAAAESAALADGLELNRRRREAAEPFAAAVTAGLAELGMEAAVFTVAVDDGPDGAALAARATELGLGRVEFVAAPNPGEEPRPLARIASGGELARVALAVESELAGAEGVPLLVFDEVDADVGPRMGEVIGRRLAVLARGRQVLVVTHLAQVAAFADTHLRVEKETREGRTTTRVRALSGEERVHELAEMARGRGRAEQALEQARAMLSEAASARSAPGETVV